MAFAIILVWLCASAQASGSARLTVVSARASMVTGGDVLVELTGAARRAAPRFSAGRVRLRATSQPSPEGRKLFLLRELPLGRVTIVARLRGRGGRQRKLTVRIVNHPISGPVFSGRHQSPFICQTVESDMGPALDRNCSARTRLEYFYKSAVTEQFTPLNDPQGAYPADVATTTTTEGRTVPYVVRVESGTINRAVYRIAVLDDQHARRDGAWWPDAGWNRRLVYKFGGSCGKGYRQGVIPLKTPVAPEPVSLDTDGNDAGAVVGQETIMHDVFLSRGYATASSSLNILGVGCNDVLSAETMMMVKEHLIERYGPPRYTLGWGHSGGAIQQHQIAHAYPGLLDGMMPGWTFPDIPTTSLDVYDCRLLNRLYLADPTRWTALKQAAVNGHQSIALCQEWDAVIGPTIVASKCPAVVPRSLWYDAASNPTGARCTLQDQMKSVYGTDPRTGFARFWYDGVGVQYGLGALNGGAITPDDFIALNRGIGGYDIDGNFVAQRSVGNPIAIRRAYETGRVTTGPGGLTRIPIIDMSGPLGVAVEEAHDRVRPFMVRARLGHVDPSLAGQVMWSGNGLMVKIDGPDGAAGGTPRALDVLDRWLSRLQRDGDAGPWTPAELARARPTDATDQCWIAPYLSLEEPASYTAPNRCNVLFPPRASPRQVAGQTLAHDVLKCQLKPLDFADYRVPFTPAQHDELRAIFPSGVCDNTKPGLGVRPMARTWMRFGG